MNKKQAKEVAQFEIMQQIANALLSYQETTGNNNDEVCLEIRKQADRVAKLFGFDKAWHN